MFLKKIQEKLQKIREKRLQKIKEKYEDDFLKRRGVWAVGLSHKITNGKDTGKTCISVWVEFKRSDIFLSKAERIPRKLGRLGFRVLTDVVEDEDIPEIKEVNRRAFQRPIKGGMSCSHHLATAGTAGCLVYKDDKEYILTNNHVGVCDYLGGKKGDPVYSPGRIDIPRSEWQKNRDMYIIGEVADFIPINFNEVNELDVCFVETKDMKSIILDIGEISGVTKEKIGKKIKISGRTSKVSHGKITGINFTLNVNFRQKDGSRKLVRWKNQIISSPVSRPGDSGAVALDEKNQIVGLLFAGSRRISVFNPIQPILDLGYSFQKPKNKPEYLIVHHTATSRDKTSFEAVRRFHIRERGMSDIAYHYFITSDGKLWEGRPRDKIGGHTEGMNHKSLGICLAGNFEKEIPSEKQLETLRDLLDYLRGEYNIPLKNVLGHREVVATLCPGKNLFSWVKEYRKGIDRLNQSLILIEEIRQKLNKLEEEIKRSNNN